MSDIDLDEALTAAIWGLWARDQHPSVWGQLQAVGATTTASGGGGSNGPRSKPPMALGALSLTHEIATVLAIELNGRINGDHGYFNFQGIAHATEVPAGRDPFRNAVRLAHRYRGQGRPTAKLTHQLVDWTDQANRLLGNVAARLTHIRGRACLHCGARTVFARQDIVVPAIRVLWSGDRIIALDCAHCGHLYAVTGTGLAAFATS